MDLSFLIFRLLLILVCISDSVGPRRRGGRWGRRRYYGPPPRPPRKISTPEECARHCDSDERAKTCHYHWTIEFYSSVNHACNLCDYPNQTRLTADCQCIMADGVDKSGMVVANRMYPGPSIQVCLGDYVVVDVKNQVPGNEITIHWHGIHMKNAQYYDGVPMVTQCPIPQGTTFRYQWTADNDGTHFWHAHTGLHKEDGLEGPLIVRKPKEDDPNADEYDYDEFDNFIFITDWYHHNGPSHFPGSNVRRGNQSPSNFLINGKGRWTDPETDEPTDVELAVFNVEEGGRYRFRIINGCSHICPAILSIENHEMLLIAMDGYDVKPRTVNAIVSYSGERFDIVVDAKESGGSHLIHVTSGDECDNLGQVAILQYGDADIPDDVELNSETPEGIIFNRGDEDCDDADDVLCVKNVENAESVPHKILDRKADYVIYTPYFIYTWNIDDLFEPDTYQPYFSPIPEMDAIALVEGISLGHPPAPVLSQFDDIPTEEICDVDNLPPRCEENRETPCICIHVATVPLNSIVDIVMTDEGGAAELPHPWHLHGHGFYVLGQGKLDKVNITYENLADAVHEDEDYYQTENKKPPLKDTIIVPVGGYAIVRFIADNPGFWLFHCHFLFHTLMGMGIVIQVGEISDVPPVPDDFPKCGDFLPSIDDKC